MGSQYVVNSMIRMWQEQSDWIVCHFPGRESNQIEVKNQ